MGAVVAPSVNRCVADVLALAASRLRDQAGDGGLNGMVDVVTSASAEVAALEGVPPSELAHYVWMALAAHMGCGLGKVAGRLVGLRRRELGGLASTAFGLVDNGRISL